MSYVIAGQTISLDGYVADANGSAESLYPDLADLRGSDYMKGLIDEKEYARLLKSLPDLAEKAAKVETDFSSADELGPVR